MELKTLILVIGAALILAVLAHGFYLTWRARRDDLRMDIQAPATSEPFDEMDLLRAELPTGGARVKSHPPAQGRLDLDGREPLLMETSGAGLPPTVAANDHPADEPVRAQAPDRVADVKLPDEPILTTEVTPEASGSASRGADDSASVRQRRPAAKQPRIERSNRESPADDELSELIVINVICRDGRKLPGAQLVEIFLASGLKFGEMNIYHNKDPLTRATRYSVANAVEPGTFDLSAMEQFDTPGVTFFMRMPGAEPALEVFEHMLRTAQDVARRLGGELRDEQHSVITQQTIAHCRNRITEFYRKRLSRRAV